MGVPKKSQPHCVVVPEQLPADLRFIMDAWTEMPEAIKAGVLAMVRATVKRGDGK
jgi:hypothetical protein